MLIALYEFTTTRTNEDNEFIIPPWLFEVKRKIVLVEIPYCLKNESSSKQFIKKFNKFTNDTFDVRIKWLTKKVKTHLHQACKIYKCVWSCGESYIGETIRNVEVRWDEHNNPMNKSNSSKLIRDNLDHVFNWSVWANAPKNMFQRKVLETYYVVLEKPTLHEQLEQIKSISKRCNLIVL